MGKEVIVRETEKGKYFVTDDLAFEVDYDLLNYNITKEIKELCAVLNKIYRKSNSTAIVDLLNDVSHSLELTINLGKGKKKTITRKDYEDMGMI